MSKSRRHLSASRGLVTRLFSMLLGGVVAASMIIAMQLPLLHQPATGRVSIAPVALSSGSLSPIAWPTMGSAALIIPSLGVTSSWHDAVVPIASLVKMMTAYVTLQKLPLALGGSGPCLVVSAADVATYQEMNATGQSNIKVAVGESLCEIDLLDGLLVHSANNFAVMLATLVSGNVSSFVDQMNQTASSLGLTHTHYVEPSGYDPASVSTALEQGRLAIRLMASPLVRSIVVKSTVTLPVAGTVGTFTPFINTNNVIGVKSGRTAAAGGCDVMAMTFRQGSTTRVLYVVILGQRGGDLLGPAGDAALALADSAVGHQLSLVFPSAERVATIGWASHVTPVQLAQRHEIWWWAAQGPLSLSVALKRFTSTIRRGQLVGWLVVRGPATYRFALVAGATVSAPTLLQRLR